MRHIGKNPTTNLEFWHGNFGTELLDCDQRGRIIIIPAKLLYVYEIDAHGVPNLLEQEMLAMCKLFLAP